MWEEDVESLNRKGVKLVNNNTNTNTSIIIHYANGTKASNTHNLAMRKS